MDKPNLPKTSEWAQETLDWFEAWKESPRTDGWDMAQWQFMFDTAVVHSLIYGSEMFHMLGELRSRLSYMGLDFEPVKTNTVEVKVTSYDKLMERYSRGDKARRVSNS